MEKINKDLLDKLLGENFEFRKAYELHSDYKKKVEEMERKGFLKSDEEIERNRLKKLKLAQKDKMEEIILQYKNEGAGTR
ncbi:MAG: hypothetical protein A2073_07645 [Deltaproteobacteria bacterium GWC2_42_11]|nr:MAG: hypothetical protein A2073_07645 [Deltaproteobacteria bacterium GWC2_42_11]HBO84427.1 DUF465 domain-containing protein [Deltaproteobacteria bacterium]